jgi:hypothetical protein
MACGLPCLLMQTFIRANWKVLTSNDPCPNDVDNLKGILLIFLETDDEGGIHLHGVDHDLSGDDLLHIGAALLTHGQERAV